MINVAIFRSKQNRGGFIAGLVIRTGHLTLSCFSCSACIEKDTQPGELKYGELNN
jgi:hypothetical protein